MLSGAEHHLHGAGRIALGRLPPSLPAKIGFCPVHIGDSRDDSAVSRPCAARRSIPSRLVPSGFFDEQMHASLGQIQRYRDMQMGRRGDDCDVGAVRQGGRPRWNSSARLRIARRSARIASCSFHRWKGSCDRSVGSTEGGDAQSSRTPTMRTRFAEGVCRVDILGSLI